MFQLARYLSVDRRVKINMDKTEWILCKGEFPMKKLSEFKSLFKFSARVGFCGKFDAPQGKNMQFY